MNQIHQIKGNMFNIFCSCSTLIWDLFGAIRMSRRYSSPCEVMANMSRVTDATAATVLSHKSFILRILFVYATFLCVPKKSSQEG